MDAETAQTEIKIVLIGESFVGKTSIVHRLTTDTFSDKENPTLGAAFASLESEINGQKVLYQFWDTAGQEQYREMAPLYFEGSNAIICVFSITDKQSFESVDHWAKIVNDNITQDLPFLIVGNKIDLEDERKVQYSEGLEKAITNNAQYIEVSAKSGVGFKQLLESVTHLYFENEVKKQKEKQRLLVTDNQFDDQVEMVPSETEAIKVDNCCIIS